MSFKSRTQPGQLKWDGLERYQSAGQLAFASIFGHVSTLFQFPSAMSPARSDTVDLIFLPLLGFFYSTGHGHGVCSGAGRESQQEPECEWLIGV